MATYTKVVLAERPTAAIIPGQTFKLKQERRPTANDLSDGEVLIETRYLSLDPAMRGWLNDRRSYVPPVPIGGVMRGAVVAQVIASKSPSYREGDYVTASPGWTELAIVKGSDKELAKLELPKGGRLTDALGVLGMTGLTAYFGILDVGQVKAGDFVVVSGAAGATGSVVGQIAKLKGAKVLGTAGSDEKCRWLKEELGFDEALNYKDGDFPKKFREATKGLIDVFFDNVGGEQLDLALARAKPFARFVICGGTFRHFCSDRYVLMNSSYQSVQHRRASGTKGTLSVDLMACAGD
jgi:NADPH-dependent curcumin reductase CurA